MIYLPGLLPGVSLRSEATRWPRICFLISRHWAANDLNPRPCAGVSLRSEVEIAARRPRIIVLKPRHGGL
jgi:hypothetical protein